MKLHEHVRQAGANKDGSRNNDGNDQLLKAVHDSRPLRPQAQPICTFARQRGARMPLNAWSA